MTASKLKRSIIVALKQNMLPGLILQSFAISLALAYFFIPASAPVFNFFGELKATHTWRYSAIATSIFGGLLPFLYLLATRQIREGAARVAVFYLIFWAIKGVEVDFFYRLQGHIFGNDNHFYTILKKVLVDQLIYSPLWTTPSIALIYLWRDCNFSLRDWWQKIHDEEVWKLHIPTVIVSSWLIWFPAVSIIYTMPPLLQVPLFNLVLCFFVLLLATLSKNRQERSG